MLRTKMTEDNPTLKVRATTVRRNTKRFMATILLPGHAIIKMFRSREPSNAGLYLPPARDTRGGQFQRTLMRGKVAGGQARGPVRRDLQIDGYATPTRQSCCCPTSGDGAPFHSPTTHTRCVHRINKFHR